MNAPASAPQTEPATGVHGQGGGEAGLIARAKVDPRAFGELYRLHYAAVAGCIYRRTGDTHITEDLAAETFISAYRAIGKYRPGPAPIRYWLLRIATNTVNRWSRRNRRAAWLRLVRPEVRTQPPTDRSSLLEALGRLPAAQQSVVSLHYFEGLGVEEVGAVLGCAPGTVKSRLARARSALRELLADGGER